MTSTLTFQEAIDTVAEQIATDVARDGYCICRNFLSPAATEDLRLKLRAWWEEGELRRAGIGRGGNLTVRDDIRGDYVRWIDTACPGQFAEFFAGHYEPLRLAFNRSLYLGLWDFEGHVTVYPPGRFYARHVDRFADASHRKLSAILYLNHDWQPDEGGELRMYMPQGDGSESHLDILPEGGTLVTFLSHEFPHEVLPAIRERFSLTGWFRTRS